MILTNKKQMRITAVILPQPPHSHFYQKRNKRLVINWLQA